MKIKILSLIISLCCILVISTNGQNQKAISENAIWVSYYQIGSPPTCYSRLYKTGKDTLINSNAYIKMYMAPVHQTGANSFQIDAPFQYHLAFRNDLNNRAFVIPANDNTEQLWYDFNLTVGDTLPNISKWYSTQFIDQGDTIIVTSIDSIFYCNKYYTRYNFNHPQFPCLVREVGFTGDLINYNGIYFEYAVSLSKFISDTSMTDCSIILTGLENIIPGSPTIKIYENNTNNIVFIESSINSNIKILNINGQVIKHVMSNSNSTSVDLNTLPNGVYIIRVTTDKEIFTKKIVKE
ncbi:MAG TPA: T9SS type A sorting domain-containing protein [Bacteroidales bacterium]|nr:T9SS type A sorting domain-containing protein [Bacteroidales bacterium]HPS16910.1 T9SS type A sorting domain-containing protein [Bacteroidales bacterium]